jgi:hypothetical protein
VVSGGVWCTKNGGFWDSGFPITDDYRKLELYENQLRGWGN